MDLKALVLAPRGQDVTHDTKFASSIYIIRQLNALDGDVHVFVAHDIGPEDLLNRQVRAPQTLYLKIQAQVMLSKNLDVRNGLVNGSRGVVTG